MSTELEKMMQTRRLFKLRLQLLDTFYSSGEYMNKFRIISNDDTNISRSFFVLWRTYIDTCLAEGEPGDDDGPVFVQQGGTLAKKYGWDFILLQGCESFAVEDLVCCFQDFINADFKVEQL